MKITINFLKMLKPTFKTLVLATALSLSYSFANAQYNVNWTNGANVSITGGSITKTGGFGYDGRGISTNELYACVDGSFEYTAANATIQSRYIGFTINGGSTSSDIKHGILINYGTLSSIQNGTVTYWGSVADGDRFKFERVGNQIILTALDCSNCFSGNPLTYSISTPSTTWNVAVAMFNNGDNVSNVTASFPAVNTTCNIDLWNRDNSTGTLYNIYQNDNIGLGTMSASERLDINGKLRVRTTDQDNSLTKFAVLDGSGVLKYRDNLTLTPFDGWYKQGTTNVPTSITDDIFTSGKVKIGQQLEVTSTFSMWGGTLGGNTYDRFVMYADNSNGLLFEAPKATNSNFGTRLPIAFSWRGDLNPSMVISSSQYVGIGTTTPNSKLTIAGHTAPSADNTYTLGRSSYRWNEIFCTNATINTSDINKKTNIEDLRYGIKDIMNLRPVTYNWKENDNGTRIGFIAQELENTLPEVVVKEDDNYGVRYTEIIPVLVQGIKDQQEIINTQSQRIDQLEKDLEDIKAMLKQQGQTAPAQQNNINVITILPNPTSGKTTVEYSIKSEYSSASIVVYNELGQKVGEYSVTQPQNGSIEFDVTGYKGGAYFCKLIVDESVLEVKKFIVSK